jgi:hypothetical protein
MRHKSLFFGEPGWYRTNDLLIESRFQEPLNLQGYSCNIIKKALLKCRLEGSDLLARGQAVLSVRNGTKIPR